MFCLILFVLFSLKIVVDEKHFLIKFQFNNPLVFVLACYLILVYQKMDLSLLALTSFNNRIFNNKLVSFYQFQKSFFHKNQFCTDSNSDVYNRNELQNLSTQGLRNIAKTSTFIWGQIRSRK